MIINSIKNINLNNSYKFKTKENNALKSSNSSFLMPSFQRLGALTSIVNTNKNKNAKLSEEFFYLDGKVSAKTCEDIVSNYPSILVEAYKIYSQFASDKHKTLSMSPEITAKAAFNLKSYFDEKYKNYRIISIGTSPAPIANTIECLGADVIYLPVSGASKLLERSYLSFIKRPKPMELRNVKLIQKYIESKIPKNDDKVNILLDFTLTGDSMSAVEGILKNTPKLKGSIIEKCSLIDTLLKSRDCVAAVEMDTDEVDKIYDDCIREHIEYISCVPHFDVDDSVNLEWQKLGHDDYIVSEGKLARTVFRDFEKYSTRLSRAYGLCSYNELKKLGKV